ncbi:MAG: hypothetical protein ACK5PB_09950 [Pirellula sp.]
MLVINESTLQKATNSRHSTSLIFRIRQACVLNIKIVVVLGLNLFDITQGDAHQSDERKVDLAWSWVDANTAMKDITHEQQRVRLTQLVEQSKKYWHGVKFVVNSD